MNIVVTESPNRRYCVACMARDPKKAFEIRFGDSSVANVTVMTICEDCLTEINRQSEVCLNEEQDTE